MSIIYIYICIYIYIISVHGPRLLSLAHETLVMDSVSTSPCSCVVSC